MFLSLGSRVLLLCCAAWVALTTLRAVATEAAAWSEHGLLRKLLLALSAPLSVVGLASWCVGPGGRQCCAANAWQQVAPQPPAVQ